MTRRKDISDARVKLNRQVDRHYRIMLHNGADKARLDRAKQALTRTISTLKRPADYDAAVGLRAYYTEEPRS